MSSPYPVGRTWSEDEFSYEILAGEPPVGFDCGRDAQNFFLYQYAWADQQARLSTTYLFFIADELAAFATVVMDSLTLGRQEHGGEIRFKHVAALKLGQLGVDLRFAGKGLGRFIVGFTISLARTLGERVGCRYLTLDAAPDLAPWYEQQAFRRNVLMQAQRIGEAERFGRKAEEVAVSMRFDLR